jgi:hypothetical protein
MLDPDSNYNVSKAIITSHILMVDSTIYGKIGDGLLLLSNIRPVSSRFSHCSAPQGLLLWRRLSPAVLGQARPILGLMPGMEGSGLSGFRYDTDTA